MTTTDPRLAYTPYAGDFSSYGQGPEHNWFQLPTAPNADQAQISRDPAAMVVNPDPAGVLSLPQFSSEGGSSPGQPGAAGSWGGRDSFSDPTAGPIADRFADLGSFGRGALGAVSAMPGPVGIAGGLISGAVGVNNSLATNEARAALGMSPQSPVGGFIGNSLPGRALGALGLNIGNRSAANYGWADVLNNAMLDPQDRAQIAENARNEAHTDYSGMGHAGPNTEVNNTRDPSARSNVEVGQIGSSFSGDTAGSGQGVGASEGWGSGTGTDNESGGMSWARGGRLKSPHPHGLSAYASGGDVGDSQPGQSDDDWRYGNILPLATRGPDSNPEFKLAWPGILRSMASGVEDIAQARTTPQRTLTPDALGALMAVPLGGTAPAGAVGSMAVRRAAELDLSPAARAARAAEMYPVQAYHGTKSDIPAFAHVEPGAGAGLVPDSSMGHFFSENPAVAEKYADSARRITGADIAAARSRYEDEAAMALRQNDPDLISAKSNLQALEREGANVVPVNLNLGRNFAVDRLGAGYDPQQYADILSRAKAKNYDSVSMRNAVDGSGIPSTVHVVFDPKNIRSRFAAFDPAHRDSPDLLNARGGSVGHGLGRYATGGPTWSGSLYDTRGAGDYLLDETQPDDPLLRAATYGSRFGAPMSSDYAPVDLPAPETWGTVVAPMPRQSVDLPNDDRGRPVTRNGDDLTGLQPPALMGGGPDVVAPIPQDSRPKSVTPLGVQVPIQPQSGLSPEFLAAYQRVIGTTPTDPSVPTQPATIGSQTQETRTPQDAGTTTEMSRSPGQSSGAAQPDAGMTQAELDQRMFDIPGMVKYDQAPAAGVAAVANKGAQQQKTQAVRAKIQKAMTAARDISRMTATLAPNASLGDAVAYYGGANKLPPQWRQRAGLGPTQTAIAPGAVPQAGQLYARGGSIKLPKIGPAKGIGGALDQMRTPVGLIDHASPGRADRVVTSLPQGGFVIPADTVSSLGQGNTLAGAKQLDGALGLTSGEQRGLGAYADGGQVHVRVAGGEYHIPPDKVAEIGHGDIDKGHQILHDAVLGWRKNNIRTLQGLPGPKR